MQARAASFSQRRRAESRYNTAAPVVVVVIPKASARGVAAAAHTHTAASARAAPVNVPPSAAAAAMLSLFFFARTSLHQLLQLDVSTATLLLLLFHLSSCILARAAAAPGRLSLSRSPIYRHRVPAERLSTPRTLFSTSSPVLSTPPSKQCALLLQTHLLHSLRLLRSVQLATVLMRYHTFVHSRAPLVRLGSGCYTRTG